MSDSSMAGRSAAHTVCWKHLELASYDAALDHAKSLIDREPDRPDGYVFKARALFKLKRFKEAEQVLLQILQIVEQNDALKSDVEGLIKLKDELANARVEILRSHKFRDAIDIAQMHWNDNKEPIIELIGFSTISKSRLNPNSEISSQTPMEVDLEIVDIIGPEKAKQLYPEMSIQSSKHKSTPKSQDLSTYSRRRAQSSSNINLRDNEKNSSVNNSRNDSHNHLDKDIELRTVGLRTALMLAEEKNAKYEKKIEALEEELKRVYSHLLKINGEKKTAEKRAELLQKEVDSFKNNIKPHSPRVRVFTNSNRDQNRSYNSGEFTAKFGPSGDSYGVNRDNHFRYKHNI